MPLWLSALCFVAAIFVAIKMPSKGIFRWIRIVLFVLATATVLYLIAAFFLLSGIN